MKLGEAKNRGSRVVVDVQESKRLLLEDEEDSVNELPVLEVVVDHVVGFELHSPSAFTADGVEDTVSSYDGQNLLEHESKQETGTESERQVVNQEGQLDACSERCAVLHEFATTKDDSKVSDDSSDNGRDRREGRFAWNPCEQVNRRLGLDILRDGRHDGVVDETRDHLEKENKRG